MPFVTVDNIDVYYEIHGPADGSDVPWLMNISGSGNDLRISRPDRNPLNARFRVVHFDQRGLGQTSLSPVEPTMAMFAADAAALANALDIARCHVVGTSFGGMVAQHLAMDHPQRVDRLVLNCTSPGGEFASYPLQDLAQMPPDERVRETLRLWDRRADPDSAEPMPGLGAFGVAVRDQIRKGRAEEARPGYEAQVRARSHHDVVARLPNIAAPTLVAAGRYDDLAPAINSEELARRIPNARLELFEGGHFFPMQDQSCWDVITAFLRDE